MTEFLNILNIVVVFFVAYHYARNEYKKIKFNQAMDDAILARARERGMKKRPDDTHKSLAKRVNSSSRFYFDDPFVFGLSKQDGLAVVQTGSGGNNG